MLKKLNTFVRQTDNFLSHCENTLLQGSSLRTIDVEEIGFFHEGNAYLVFNVSIMETSPKDLHEMHVFESDLIMKVLLYQFYINLSI